MTVVLPYINKLNSISSELEQVAVNIVKENIDFILFLLKEKQLKENIKSDGGWIGFYKKSTEEYAKDPFNRPREPKVAGQGFNMEWSGQFLDNMVVQSKKDSFSIFSRDGKQKILEKKYGVLTKLTEQHNTIFNEEVMKPKLYQYVLENMFKV